MCYMFCVRGCYNAYVKHHMGIPGGTVLKNSSVNWRDARDADSIPGSRKIPAVGNGNPLHHTC